MKPRRKKPIPTLPAERLVQLLEENDMKQVDLCKDTDKTYRMNKSEVSELCNAVRPLTREKAQTLIDHFFPGIRVEWLIGESDFKTEKDSDRALLWDLYLNYANDQQQIHCLDFFMQHYGYRIEEYPVINKDMGVPDLRRAMQIIQESNGITYRIRKDGEIIRELSSSDFARLKDKITILIATMLEP
jgi:hypothetical protein